MAIFYNSFDLSEVFVRPASGPYNQVERTIAAAYVS